MYREAFTRAGTGMALLSPQGEWIAVNPALCRLLGRREDALLGTRAHAELFDAATAAWIDDARVDTADAGDDARQRREADVDGQALWLSRTALPDAAASGTATLLQVDDASEQHRHRQRDQELERLQDNLAYGISHDLRAPLRGIAGFAERLDEAGAIAGEEGRSDLARIRAAAARADRLVDELLELLRATRRPHHDEDVDISLLCEWVTAELQDADPERAAEVEIPPGLTARGDEHALKTLLHKVLDNAWKFSAGRERVRVVVEGRTEGERLRLSIRDHGGGFDMRYADKLFLPFQRLHSAEQGGGNGLGLAIARQLAERHGGRIWAQSQPGEGSTFFIELPAATGSTIDDAP